MDAEDLQKGDGIWSLDGDYGTVEKVVVVEDVYQPMYNLTVDEAHTYFIADGDWLVHNVCFTDEVENFISENENRYGPPGDARRRAAQDLVNELSGGVEGGVLQICRLSRVVM